MTYATLRSLLSMKMAGLDQAALLCRERLARRQEFAHSGADDILADSLAGRLHSFYGELERLLETIAAELDELPPGPRWHKKLLEVMALDVPGLRPAVLSASAREGLDELRAFRHLCRDLCGHTLRPERVFALAGRLAGTWDATRADLEQFIAFLAELDGRA